MADPAVFILVAFVPALVTALLLVPLLRRAALAAGLVAQVRPDRLHREVRPYGGGLAIAATLGLAFIVVAALPCMNLAGADGLRAAWPFLLRLALGAFLFLVLGLIDDRFSLGAPAKLALQFLAAGIVVVGFGIKATVWLSLPWAPEAVSILWIVVVVNAFNLFDHADGIAATAAVVAFGALAAGQLLVGERVVPAAALATAGAAAGFLVHNFPPARLFMGDAGSSLLGYLLAALMMAGRYYFPDSNMTPYVVFVPLSILAVPLFDLGCVLAGRLARRTNPFAGDATRHLAHRMLAAGWRPRSIVVFVAVVSGVAGAASAPMYEVAGARLVGTWGLVAAALLAVFLARQPRPLRRSEDRGSRIEETAPARGRRAAPAQPAAMPGVLGPSLLAHGLRRGVIALGAAGLLVLPQLTPIASFIGVAGTPGPVAMLSLGLAFWLMPVLLVASWAAEGRVRLPHPGFFVAATLMGVGVGVSTASADDRASALVRGAELSGLWMGAAALAQALRTDAERRLLLAALVAAAGVAAGLAIEQAGIGLPNSWQYFQEHRLEVLAQLGIPPGGALERAYVARFTGGVQSSLGHPNVLAAFLLAGIFAAVGLAREKWREVATRPARVLAVLLLALAALCAVALFLTDSRAGAAALVVGLYWLAVAWRVRRRAVRIALYLAPLVLAGMGLAVVANVDSPAAESALKTLRYRLDYWQAAASILREHGLAGVGLDNFRLHYVGFKTPAAPEEVSDPHNLVLSTWSSLGLAGVAALAVLAGVAIRGWLCRRPAERSSDTGPVPDEALPPLLAPPLVLAAPLVIGYFLMGPLLGVGAIGVMAVVIALVLTERGARIAATGRPLQSAVTACIVGVAALVLMEQIGTAVLEPPTAWALLVLVVVSVGACPSRCSHGAQGPALRNGGQTTAGAKGSPAEDKSAATAKPPGRERGPAAKFALMLLAMGLVFGYVRGLLVPVLRESALLDMAGRTEDLFEQDEMLRAAGDVNPLAWEPAMIRGLRWQRAAQGGRGPGSTIALQRAAEAYGEALERQPASRPALLSLADCLAPESGPPDPEALAAARRCLERAEALYPTSVTTHLRLAKAWVRQGDAAAALQEYRTTLALDDALPPESRRLSPEERDQAAARARQLEESLAAPAAGP
jgi:UDP-GlcNAc:undecaprenyl-phosphate/decaprenyl-phosphate GlcNAc-1-phosphate transferase